MIRTKSFKIFHGSILFKVILIAVFTCIFIYRLRNDDDNDDDDDDDNSFIWLLIHCLFFQKETSELSSDWV